ncbi:hypothetical protein [Quadrisphaera sp. DSM 44207]|uniref:hypothetical protein n=1 Tax=Quadrisphaera sp. DSM 44207 TaxID=1881057 RepID=UPI000890EBEF|nr:hypothetical protein [Quadrisphaera sp. DSM 44207]SDQ48042.1 hypothetical protein SAMN05428996_1868 [Quadrisphaera sp. DSM 44207]
MSGGAPTPIGGATPIGATTSLGAVVRDDAAQQRLDEADPWALSLVVRTERAQPPAHSDVLAAAARAVAALLLDPRVTDPDGELHEAVARWRAGRIRKIARRARGTRWERTGALPHVEARVGSAVVRVFAPHPRDAAPAELAPLQVGGLDLADPQGWAPPHVPPSALTVRTSPGVPMTTGKAAAQVGHAAQLALERLDPAAVAAWRADGLPVRVVTGTPVLPAGERVDVADGGFTEVAPGTVTASAGFEGGERP